jgi:hypothetical protein
VPLSARLAEPVAWLAFAATAAMAAGTAVFGFLDDGTRVSEDGSGTVGGAGELQFAVRIVALAAIGAFVAARRPRNPVGWILCLSPLFLGYTGVARGSYVHTFYADPGSLPLAEPLVWAANWAWIPGFMPLLTLLLLLFPEGRPVTRRWRPVGWLAVAAMGSLVLGYAFSPGALEDYERVDNPLAAEGAVGDGAEIMLAVGFPLFALAAVLSLVSLAVRFHRSAGVERQQVKWMAAAAALVVFAYRLYDLDVVVNRTLVYGALTATLAASYLGIVLVLQLALSPLTEDSGLAVAGSTLAVAALFRPARGRIQALVNRRFYRRRYDASQTIERFIGRVRDEVEPDALSGELRAVACERLQPAHVSLWLRPETGR